MKYLCYREEDRDSYKYCQKHKTPKVEGRATNKVVERKKR